MVVVLIRTQLRPDADIARYEQLGARMGELVQTMPGFISAKDFVSEDGERVSMVCFESHEALAAWKNQPEHLETQRIGKASIYAAYTIEVCEVVRTVRFP